MSSGAAGGGTWEANRRAWSSKPRAPSRISPMRAAERAASATFPCRFVLLPFSVLSVDLFLCARLGWFGGTEKPNRRNRHRTRRFLILWQTDRLLICGNRSLQQPNKPNRFVGLNRMPTLRKTVNALNYSLLLERGGIRSDPYKTSLAARHCTTVYSYTAVCCVPVCSGC